MPSKESIVIIKRMIDLDIILDPISEALKKAERSKTAKSLHPEVVESIRDTYEVIAKAIKTEKAKIQPEKVTCWECTFSHIVNTPKGERVQCYRNGDHSRPETFKSAEEGTTCKDFVHY